MLPFSRSVAAVSAVVCLLLVPLFVHARCRNQPGSTGYPSTADWSALNDSIDDRLVEVVPSAKACAELGCTDAQWESGHFPANHSWVNECRRCLNSIFALPSIPSYL